MLALKGYFNGKDFIPLENVQIKRNQKVIITVLDEFVSDSESVEKPYKKYVGKLSNEDFNELQEILKETEKIDKNEW
ncbi:MAG: hypothetical protein GX660_13655 [Clostridiaceae bacterium]|nr:hypothetical protein [Clostridiaceae bacterium]